MHRLVRQHVVIAGESGQKTIAHAIKAFMGAYEKLNPLSYDERHSMGFLMRQELVQKIHFVLQNHYLKNDRVWDNDFMKFMMLLEETVLLG